jgi:rhodanese-related sulfurtransferase
MAETSEERRVQVPEIDVSDLERRLEDGAPLIDVRQPDEYEQAHVPGAVLIPLGEVPDRVAEIPRDTTVYVICRSGSRSHTAAAFLLEQGIEAVNVAGGTLAWLAAGKPAITGAGAG